MFYAVKKGRETGIFESWAECQKQITGFSGAEFKKFKELKQAESYLTSGISVDNLSDDLDGLHAYIDGSFSNDLQETGYGAVILLNGEIIHTIKGSSKKYIEMRNVAGELFAAAVSIKWAVDNGYKSIVLHHDYSGIAHWAKGEWKCKQEGTINYKKFIDEISGKISILFIKVKGHSGDMYNDMADKLAKESLSTEEDNK
ncbi:MAG: ribonuclease H family protein [Candidatus Mucispirillum faecigallinarum]|nr:ribonuclease H family protein [Candidatus Mucispirillum faecigallinarum]